MKVSHINDMKGGWFIGNFEPSLFKNDNFEVAYKFFDKDEFHEPHTHKIATEYNYLAKGKLSVQGKTIESGQIFIFQPGELSDVVFLEKCEIVVIKTPCIKNDKFTHE